MGRMALESMSPGFQPGATPSQLPTRVAVYRLKSVHEKSPMSGGHRALQKVHAALFGRCHWRMGYTESGFACCRAKLGIPCCSEQPGRRRIMEGKPRGV